MFMVLAVTFAYLALLLGEYSKNFQRLLSFPITLLTYETS